MSTGRNSRKNRKLNFKPLPLKKTSEVDFSEITVPWHLTRELMSHFPKAKGPDSMMLDIGCGDAVHQQVCEHAGFEFIGLDYLAPEGQIRGDAQALPFADNSFEFALTIAVLHYIQNPFIMMQEVARVLKPGGKFIGTSAFLEPYRDSYYHHTHMGTYNSLAYAGFDIEYVAPSTVWTVLFAQAQMGLFPRMPSFLAKSIVYPVHILHRLWWKVGYLLKHSESISEDFRRISTTGVFTFVATKK